MDSVRSADETLIAVKKTGEGPPLVLVHGTVVDHRYWEPILPELEAHFTVFAMDRRGRGKSSDASGYKLELEFEDVAAVIDWIDEPVILLGHSYGGTISLEAALLTEKISKLILYEPQDIYMIENPEDYPHEVISEIGKNIKEGANEQALVLFLKDLVEMTPEEIESFRSTPYWQVMVDAAPTLPREIKAETEYWFDAEKFKNLAIPTLLLSGSESPLLFKKDVETLDNTLPDSTVTILEGRAHDAIRKAPDLFVKKVLAFLLESG